MSNAPRRPCPHPHCNYLGHASCPRHTQERDRARGTAKERGYGADWSAYSRTWLTRFPWCGQRMDGLFHEEHSRCTQRGERVRAQVTDHIVALRDGGARLDPHNHQSLCTSCNTAKSAAPYQAALRVP